MRTPFVWLWIAGAVLVGCSTHKRDVVAVYPYRHPLLSPGTKFGGLPPAVQRTVRAQAGGAEIYDVSKTITPEAVVYEIFFLNSALFPPLYVAPDGSVLYPDLMTIAVAAGHDDIGPTSGGPANGVRLSELPIKVVNTIQDLAPASEVAFISKIIANNSVMYEVTFKDSRQPMLLISENGMVIDRRRSW